MAHNNCKIEFNVEIK